MATKWQSRQSATPGPTQWFASEYVRGLTLTQYVADHGVLPADRVAALGIALAEALVTIHQAGVLHRDFKPGNIILGRDGPRVIDFGLAALTEQSGDLTSTNEVFGTPLCMSPEQAISSRDVTAATDVYALGATLTYTVAKHYPYEGETARDIQNALINPAIDPDLSGIPGALLPAISGMLAYAAAARPALNEVRKELARVLADAGQADPAVAVRRLAEATYRERPGAPAPTLTVPARERWPGPQDDPHVPSALVRQAADRLRRGIDRIQREIPAGRNPFTYYKRIIISVDTLKNVGRFGQHLDNMHWDAVVIDESHNLIGSGNQNLRHRLAERLAKRTDALLLASATPHNGDAESFAQLIKMLDPAAIADERNYQAKDIDHLYIRRTKISREVTNEIGGKWKERGPSVPLHCAASPAEEKVFEELTRIWLSDPSQAPGASNDRRLFPYTLLKTFLSSHKALAATARKRAANTADTSEKTALERLAILAVQIEDNDSAKLNRLVEHLKEIGVGHSSATRAVVFSESVPTLEWLHAVLPKKLGLTRQDQIMLMYGGLSDTRQQEIIEQFALSDSPVRVLLTGDVASEGVNMHRQCHHLVHYDLPWSLIRIEQRNGRIDRYGQEHQPQFAALTITSQVEGAKDDTTVAEKLLKREETAHSQLGTAEGVTRQFTAKKEEDRLVKDLLAGKTVEQSVDEAAGTDPGLDFLADLLGGVGDQPADIAPERARIPRLFASTEQFARAAITEAYLRMHKVDERMRVTFDKRLAQRKLDEARQTKTLWPDIGYLCDQHPMIEWLTDKVLLSVPRQQAPVLLAKVTEPAFLIEGVYSNTFGQPTVVEWMAVTGLPATPRIADMADALAAAHVGPALVNTLEFGDIARLEHLVPAAVDAARVHLEDCRAEYSARPPKNCAASPTRSAPQANHCSASSPSSPPWQAEQPRRTPDELRLHHQPRRLPLPALPRRGAAPRPGQEDQPPHPLGRARQGGRAHPGQGPGG